MGTDIYRLLVSAIEAVKEGRKAEARELLLQVIREDSRNEAAWLWLSGAVEDDEQRRICLQNVLAINPDNEAAQRGLQALEEGTSPDTEQGPHMEESHDERRSERE